MNSHDKLMATEMNRTSSIPQRYEASLPGGGRDVVAPVVGAGSYGDPVGLEFGAVEVSLRVTANFWP